MAVKIPVTFKRVAEAFEEVAQRSKGCSERYFPADDLLDRVNSFIERGNDDNEEIVDYEKKESYEISIDNAREMLKDLLNDDDDDDDHIKRTLRVETEQAYGDAGGIKYSPEFKLLLMTRLRQRGFDAGLCKTSWERTGQIPPGNYEYIDVKVAGTRYIIEVFFNGEFEIARPTKTYTSLLGLLPFNFVGKLDELNKIAKIMCKAIKLSLHHVEMHVPPWRTYGYVKAKWSSAYRRLTNARDSDDRRAMTDDIYSPLHVMRALSCRRNLVDKVGARVGNLAMALSEIR